MIYFDNSSTTLIKPKEVAEAVSFAINNFGNASRSFYSSAMLASREVYNTRKLIAELVKQEDPLKVAFTSSATESLNLVIRSLINKEDHVITTVLEHNSVLRPLYLTCCDISFLESDKNGNLLIDKIENLIKENTKFLICTHGSNVTGNVNHIKKIYEICKKNNIVMILDISQTFGQIDISENLADILCFTGHKGLFGPQGTGGIIVNADLPFRIVKTGGSGANSFDRFQINEMPDVFEAGTLNCHGIYGLQKGILFLKEKGINNIHKKEMKLTKLFYDAVSKNEKIKIYGNFDDFGLNRLPIVSINIESMSSAELSQMLWEDYKIATRSGSHCAPLLHKHFKTVEQGMVRFSFSYFNTEAEINIAIKAIEKITKGM